MKKKLITLLLMTVTVASLVACGEKVDTDTNAPSQAVSVTSGNQDVILDDVNADGAIDKIPQVTETPVSEEVEVTVEENDKDQDGDEEVTEMEEAVDKTDAVTAAMLIDNMYNFDYDYINSEMSIVLNTSTGNSKIDMTIEADNNWAYTVTNFDGMNVVTWIDSNNNRAYTQVNGGWVKTDAQTQDYTKMGNGLTSDKCERLELKTTDDYYEVTCTIPAEVAKQIMGSNGNTQYSDVDLSGITYYATYRFDKETKELLYCKININVSDEVQREEGMEINQYYIECKYLEYDTGKTLTPPSFK